MDTSSETFYNDFAKENVNVSKTGGSQTQVSNSGNSASTPPDGDWEPEEDNSSNKIKNIIDETLNNNGNITSEHTITEDEFFDLADKWLGDNYVEIGKENSGVYRNLDGTRQLRIDNNSLLGNHNPWESHVHIETIGSDGRAILTSNHIILK